MCFENIHQVSCVSFAPSSGLNDSLLAVAAGRKITLYLMNVEEFQVPEQFSPSIASEADDYQSNVDFENGPLSSNAVSSSIDIDKMSNISTPASAYIHSNHNSVNSNSSPLLPDNFFKSDGSPLAESSQNKEGDKEDSDTSCNSPDFPEEEEKEPSDSRKALMWNVKWIAVFRESCAITRIQWGRNPDNFTAHLIDGRIQGYKWSFGCVWTRSTDLQLHGIQTSSQYHD